MPMIVEVRNVSCSYQTADAEVEALRDVSLAIEEGEFVSLVGPSGCGKSTLLALLAGLEQPTRGEIVIDGERVKGPSGQIGYMPQHDELFAWRSIRANALLAPELRHDRSPAVRERVDGLLEQYGLGAFRNAVPAQLSGGMRQRAALIRTLAHDPKLLLLDEPFSALDYQTRLTVSADIRAIIRKEGKTALLVTHDIGEALALSDRVIVLSARPGEVRAEHELRELRPLTPSQRRDDAAFLLAFNMIWKELDGHGAA